jgi:hypothetical protein
MMSLLLVDDSIPFLNNLLFDTFTFLNLFDGYLNSSFGIIVVFFGLFQGLGFLLNDNSSLILRFDGLIEFHFVHCVYDVSHCNGMSSHSEHLFDCMITLGTKSSGFMDVIQFSVKPFLVDCFTLETAFKTSSVDSSTTLSLCFFSGKLINFRLFSFGLLYGLCLFITSCIVHIIDKLISIFSRGDRDHSLSRSFHCVCGRGDCSVGFDRSFHCVFDRGDLGCSDFGDGLDKSLYRGFNYPIASLGRKSIRRSLDRGNFGRRSTSRCK